MASVQAEHAWLVDLETPYLWRPSDQLDPGEHAHLLHRLGSREQRTNDSKIFAFDHFVIKLLLGYELFAVTKNATAAMSTLEQLEMDLFWMDIVSNCSFYREVRRAQWHTMLASRAVLLASLGRLDESREVVGVNFDPVSTFNPVERSAICGIKCRAYLEYGPKAWPEALRWAKEAIRVNPHEAEWYFLAGRTLQNIRLESGRLTGISKQEIDFFERATALGGRGNRAVHLAWQVGTENIGTEEMDLLVKNHTHRSIEQYKNTINSSEENVVI